MTRAPSRRLGGSPRWRRNQRLKCVCIGYHFPHRRGGGACDHSRTRELHVAIRGGNAEEILEAHLGLALEGHGQVVRKCPF